MKTPTSMAPSIREISPSINNTTGSTSAKIEVRICLIVGESRYRRFESTKTKPSTNVRSATFAPKITPNPSEDEPSRAAMMPIESSGRTAIMPAMMKLVVNSESRKYLDRLSSLFIATSAVMITMANPAQRSNKEKSAITNQVHIKSNVI